MSTESTTTANERAPETPGQEHGLVSVITPEEAEFRDQQTQVEARRREAADLQAEVETLKLTLGRFEAEYHARVGYLFIELDSLRLSCDEYSRRIAGLRAQHWADLGAMEDEIHESFADRRQRLTNDETENRRYQEAHQDEQARPPLDPDTAAELRRVYRDLARRYHPDLARTVEERDRREAIMLRVNTAYRDRELAVLHEIAAQGEVEDPSFAFRPIAERLRWAKGELTRLGGVITRAAEQLRRIRASDTYRLWNRSQNDASLLDRLAEDLRGDIARATARLDNQKTTYQELLAPRGLPVSPSPYHDD